MRTCPPSTSWYSSESAQQIFSGNQRGTVTAIVPPGRSTRTSSAIAASSSGMCSRTSAATTRSNSPSAKGSESASPCFTSASAPSGTWFSDRIAANISDTADSSSASWSNAMTSVPRRYSSNAWRPAPQPMSRTRSPGWTPRRSKSTVSIWSALLVRLVVDCALVRRRSGLRHRTPAELLQGALPSCGAHAVPSLRVVEERLERCRELPHVAGRDQVRAQPVLTHHLGDRARPADYERGAAGHRLHRGQREAFVERRHAGDLGRADHLGEVRVAQPAHEADAVLDRQPLDELLGATA